MQYNHSNCIYRDVRDLDLYVGGVSERRLPGNAMGPTFACINGVQFYHSKYGDRFFYEHGGESGSFTSGKKTMSADEQLFWFPFFLLEQLENIKATTSMMRFICKTTKNSAISRNPFRMPSHDNPEIDCSMVPEIDYDLWREEGNMYAK